jgi:hypothetical protein
MVLAQLEVREAGGEIEKLLSVRINSRREVERAVCAR